MIRQLRYLLIFSALLLIGCSTAEVANNSEPATVAVRSAAVQQNDFPVVLTLTGTIKGEFQTVMPAKITSSVTTLDVRVGQRVSAGDIVLQLDRGGLQSQYHQTEALYLDAQKHLRKMQSLLDAGAISERELDLTTTEYQVAKANFDAARKAVEVESPITGVITDLYIRPGDEVAPGAPLFEVADISALRLVLDVPSTQIARLKVGQPVTVSANGHTAEPMHGTVYSIADAADKNTRSFEVECRFTDPPAGFAPGTFATARIEVATLPNALLINADAILYRSGQAYSYAIDADTAALIPIQVLAYNNDHAAVSGDLTPGQRVVITGQKNLTPGTHVREAD